MKAFVRLTVLLFAVYGICGCELGVPAGATANMDAASVNQQDVVVPEKEKAETCCPAKVFSLLD